MNNTPDWIRKYWTEHPAKFCARSLEKNCHGRLTKEHVFIYAGRQIQELWAIIDLCEYHHAVNQYMDRGDLRKRVNEAIASKQASHEQRKRYEKLDWFKLDRMWYDPMADGLIRIDSGKTLILGYNNKL